MVGVITFNRMVEYFVVFYQFACMCVDGNAENGWQAAAGECDCGPKPDWGT